MRMASTRGGAKAQNVGMFKVQIVSGEEDNMRRSDDMDE